MRPLRFVPLALLLSVATAAAQSSPSERQRAVLEAGVDAVLAVAELPAGWGVERVEVVVGPDGAGDYRIVHRSDEGRCFAIEGGPARGFGGPVPPHDRAVRTPGLPTVEGVRIFWTTGPEEGGPFPVRTVISDWMPAGGLAHRFTSPSDPLGGCQAVTPETAESLVAALVRIGPALAEIEYRRLSWNDPTVEAREGEPAEETALRILEATALGLDAEARSGEAAVEERVEPLGAREGWTAVLVTRIGGADDSVAGVRYRVAFRPLEEGRLEFRIGRAFRCHTGRGHEGWGPELCL